MYVGMGAPPPHHHHGHHGGGWGGPWYGGGWGGGYSEVVEVPVAVEQPAQTASEWIAANTPLAIGVAFLAALVIFRGRS